MREDSFVSEFTGCVLDVWPSMSSVDSDFSFRHKIQTSCDAVPALYLVGRGSLCVCGGLPESGS